MFTSIALLSFSTLIAAAAIDPTKRQAGWTTCSPDTGLSASSGVQTAIDNMYANSDAPFAVNPQSYATVICDPALVVCIQIYNADPNNVLQTDQGSIADLASNVLNQCTDPSDGGVGGASSPDGNSWVVQVRATRNVCS